MKKIGIITFHFEDNYGAVLQAFALQKYLLNLNFNVEIIDFRSQNMILANKRKGIKLWINFLFAFFWIKQREKKFENFRKKYLKRSNKIFFRTEDLEKNILDYDLLIAGSDQIWNQAIDYQRAFYLDIKGCENIKKISYASSLGKEKIEEKYEKDVLYYISKIDCVSVREDKSKELLEKKLNKKIYHVLDPIFLLSSSEWRNISSEISNRKLKKGYILIYMMEYNEHILEISNRISKLYNVPRVFLSVGDFSIKKTILNLIKSDEFITNIGPKEFISLIDGATYVITNSFHGVAFSILLNTPFINIAHSKRNLRMESLMRTLKIEDQIYKNINNCILNNEKELKIFLEKITSNSKKQNLILDTEIKKSKEYLNKSIFLK